MIRPRHLKHIAALAAALSFSGSAFAYAEQSPEPVPTLSPEPAASASPSPSPTPDRLESARKKLRQDDAGLLEILKKGDELRSVIDQAMRHIAFQLQKASDRLVESQAAAKVAAERVHAKTVELDAAIADLARQKEILNERAASIYIIGPQGYLPIVLAARDINDAIAAAEYGRRALQAEAGAVIAFRNAMSKVRRQRVELIARKRSLDAQVRAATEEKKALEELQRRQRQIRNQLFTNMGANIEAISKILGGDNPFFAIIASYESTGTGFTELIDEAQRGQRLREPGQGTLQRPVAGPVTSGFGYRMHPVYGYVSRHTGIDIAADEGVPVRPALAGTVIDAGYFGAYGNTIIVDHGNRVATIYSHLSRIEVSPGEKVTLKSVLGRIGSTGWSTGPHLHFEVRLAGKAENPTRWL